MVPPLLEARGIVMEFSTGILHGGRRVRVLDGIDLRVGRGEAVALVGESGCGKTTLARCLLRLLEPASGEILLDGEDFLGLSGSVLRRRRRELQMIFQDPLGSLDPRMRVAEILAEPLEVHRLGSAEERRGRVRELIEAVGLDPSLLQRLPASLSGGQRQRVGIARALALGPRLVVADEPVSALDASVQAQILNLLADLQERFGIALLLISHALPVVRWICSRVVVMYLGHVVEESPADEFFRSPNHPYSRLLLDSASAPGAGAAPGGRQAWDIPSPSDRPAGCAFHPRCPRAFEPCRERAPRLAETAPGIKTACFLYS